jgi:diguanylate cyclase (GGDEF)-like protein/PAS domain S-box-containing protein
LGYAWTGNLGQWYWNIKTNAVTFNSLKITNLGYDKSEIPEQVTYQYFTEKLHPEDYQTTMQAMTDHLSGKKPVYEIEYRIKTKAGNYRWYHDIGKITQWDDSGKPVFLSGIVFDITDKKAIQEELEYKNQILKEISAIDGLTKISNHRTLIEYLEAEMAAESRNQQPLAIAMFDVDNFKQVNDSKGHVYGDQVLVEIAAIINNNIRKSDLAGRYGGEEFMIICANSDLETAANIAERIRLAIENNVFDDNLRITISGGVKQHQNEDLRDFIHFADRNLYIAKKEGKNRIVY